MARFADSRIGVRQEPGARNWNFLHVLRTAVYPGSFDPITLGHLDIVRRASQLFDRVIVAVIRNPNKRGLFSLPERARLIEQATASIPNVQVDSFEGLLVDYCRAQGAQAVVKGLRGPGDVEGEFQMARLNRMMASDLETLFLVADPRFIHISSTFVREISALGGDVSAMVAPETLAALLAKRRAGAGEPGA